MRGRELVALFSECRLFDLELNYLSSDLVELGRHRVHLGLDKCARLVDEVDSLVGEETVGDIAVGEGSRGNKRLVVDLHTVVDLVTFLKASENGDRVLYRGFIDGNGLETTLKRRILFDILSVFVKCRSTYAVKLTAGEHGF